MAATNTGPPLNLVKPEVGASADVWGGNLNANFDTINTAMANRVSLAGTPAATQTMANKLVLNGQTDIPGTPVTVVDGEAATTPYVTKKIADLETTLKALIETRIKKHLDIYLPLGTIIIWNGSRTAIPAGWAACTGQTVSGQTTPDLRARFVLCADPALGTTGSPPKPINDIVNSKYAQHAKQDPIQNWHDHPYQTIFAGPGPSHGTFYNGISYHMPPYYALIYIMRVTTAPTVP